MRMSDGVYDVLKWVQRLLLPACGTLYLALGSIWQGIIPLPYPEQVAATIMAVDTFLGVLLGISSAKYNADLKGRLGVKIEDGDDEWLND